jgi:hypothetical protein
MTDLIAKADLEHGAYYRGRCRNATLARWDGNRQQFRHWRTKFGDTYLEYIKHPDDETHFDVFRPQFRLWHALDGEIPLEDADG